MDTRDKIPSLARFHPDAVLTTGPDASDEPILAVDEIQGNILPGFGTRATILLGLKINDTMDSPDHARNWLRALAPSISRLRQVNEVREVRRAVARATGNRPELPDVFANAALAFSALQPLGLPTDKIGDAPFRHGIAGTNLQDPQDASGQPVGWVVGATPETTPDVLLILGSDNVEAIQDAATRLSNLASASGLTEIYREEGQALGESKEHFGFRDDISHPGVRGRLSDRPDHVLTRRYLDESDSRSRTFARPGQPLIWPGQFLFGYATELEGDPAAGPEAVPPHQWMRNGSCLAFRRLHQDVARFRRFAVEQAAAVSSQLERTVSPEEIQAWIVGRWPDGTPLANSPQGPLSHLSDDDMAVNFFAFAEDEPDAVVVEDGKTRVVPGVANDRLGLRCPHFAHIRKVNLRDKLTDQGPSSHFRILRRGIPYGPLFQDGEPPGIDRGLLFLSYQRSIDPQFLTLNATWMNTAQAPEGFGHDLLVGQDRAGRSAERVDSSGRIVASLSAPSEQAWVIPTGGGFFFCPAVSVLAGL